MLASQSHSVNCVLNDHESRRFFWSSRLSGFYVRNSNNFFLCESSFLYLNLTVSVQIIYSCSSFLFDLFRVICVVHSKNNPNYLCAYRSVVNKEFPDLSALIANSRCICLERQCSFRFGTSNSFTCTSTPY